MINGLTRPAGDGDEDGPLAKAGTVQGEAIVEGGAVRVEQPFVARLVNELLGKAVAADRVGQRAAVPARPRVEAVTVIQAFDLQGGRVVNEP